MTIYTVVEIQHNRNDRSSYITNVISSYTNEEEANKEADWRERTCDPILAYTRDAFRHQYMTRLTSRNIEFRVLITELITDKFTEFALGANDDTQNN